MDHRERSRDQLDGFHGRLHDRSAFRSAERHRRSGHVYRNVREAPRCDPGATTRGHALPAPVCDEPKQRRHEDLGRSVRRLAYMKGEPGMTEIEIHLDPESKIARKAAERARELVEALRLGNSTFMLVMDDALQAFNRGPEEARLEGLAYLNACLCGLVLKTAAVGDELVDREDVVLAETLRQCRE